MKKMKSILFIAATAILFVLFSCDNQFLSEPHFPSGGAGSATGRGIRAPEGVSASQGEKRSITLTWNEDPNAVLYHIYSAETPLNSFVRCAETRSTQYKFKVPAGSTIYYRVSSVSYNGAESTHSFYVRGTSLAQPVISDITDITESEATVKWYMDNAFEDSYKNDLLYTVYCYNGSAEFAQIALDGSADCAVFTNLASNTKYEYQVEAYLRGEQHAVEKSDKMNKETARRFRPGAPRDLRATRGTDKEKITISFELPDMVDIALGDGLYDPKPLYFVIYRRFYSESGNNEYQKACSYLGSIPGNGRETFGTNYTPGVKVTWSDPNVNRGVKYEYMVQSYVDDTLKVISSDASKSSADGWALSVGTLKVGEVAYTLGTDIAQYVSAALPLDFTFDPQNVLYNYRLIEQIEPLEEEDDNNPDTTIIRKKFLDFSTYDKIRTYTSTMDLTRKTTENNPGRGEYSYKVEILLGNETLDTISALGTVEVSENTERIIVESFRVQDGYTNKFVLTWDNYSNRKYILYTVDAEGKNEVEIKTFNDSPTTDATLNDSFFYIHETADIVPGVTRYFAIRPFREISSNNFKKGQMVYAGVSRTLGVPKLSLDGGFSYSTITAAWTEAQKADTYRIKYRYTGDSAYKTAVTVKKGDPSLKYDAFGKLVYIFQPEGNNINIAKAGLEIQIQVDALNESLRTVVGGGEISTSSKEDVRTRLVGPALLELSASKATSAQEITVKWKKITGAGGYYVFRRQFNMNNTTQEGTEAVVYYVPAIETATVDVTGKEILLDAASNSKIDALLVKARVNFAGEHYTLTDRYMTDDDYDGLYKMYTDVYRDQQIDMVQGCSYRYYVVPVISDSHTARNSIEFAYNKDSSNKNTNIASYTIQENSAGIKYSGADSLEQEGFTIGFGQDVIATKGTYTSSGNINNGIKITWKAPPRLSSVSGFNPRYNVYRRESGGSPTAWETLKLDLNATEYIETQLVGTKGIAYEYVVGISGSGGTSDPKSSKRFIDKCYTQLDEKGRPKMLGFMLDMVKMESVSRNEQKVGDKFAEEVKWKSAGIKHRNGVGNKWGIDGYEVWVMNRNIDANWHKITEIPYANIPDQIDQSVKVTQGMESVKFTSTGVNLNLDLLHVMRDYRHFFKIRNYVLNDDNERIYSQDPPYVYKYYWRDNERYQFETDYVKWGARQITATEFAIIAMVYMCDGIDQVNGTAWNTGYFGRSENANGDGTSGKVEVKSNFGVTSWDFTFTNYKTDLQVRAGGYQHFLTINGKLWASTGAANQYPKEWGYNKDIDIIGPSDTPNLYTGKMAIGGGTQRGGSVSYRDLPWGDGDISVKYPAGTADQKITLKGENTPMLYTGKGDRRYNLEDYK